MTRLPAVGGDYDSWGTILNDFLSTTIDVYALATAASPGDASVTLDRVPFGISKGAGFLIIDPFSTSCEVRLVSSVSNATVTLVRPVTVASSAISFDSATKQIRSTTETVSKFFPGARIAVTGSASNNGFYTIDDYPTDGSYDGTYITVNENLVNESVGAAVTIVMDLNRAHVAGTLDEVAVYPADIGATRVLAHYNAGIGVGEPVQVLSMQSHVFGHNMW